MEVLSPAVYPPLQTEKSHAIQRKGKDIGNTWKSRERVNVISKYFKTNLTYSGAQHFNVTSVVVFIVGGKLVMITKTQAKYNL